MANAWDEQHEAQLCMMCVPASTVPRGSFPAAHLIHNILIRQPLHPDAIVHGKTAQIVCKGLL